MRELKVPRDHPVYRHCFVGSQVEATMWLNAFPRTFFGFSPLSMSPGAHDECKKVFYNLDLARVVLETDCPQLQFRQADKQKLNPWSTWHEARWLAALRDIPMEKVLKKVCENVCELYKLPPPDHPAKYL